MEKNGVKSLAVYNEAYKLAMEIFNVSKRFPKEERYSLTDQVRRSSRSVCANLSEAYAKRIYVKHFKSKLSDCDAEKAETLTWLDFAKDCGYITTQSHEALYNGYEKVGRMLGKMLANPSAFVPRKNSKN